MTRAEESAPAEQEKPAEKQPEKANKGPASKRSEEEMVAAARKYVVPTGVGLPSEGKELGAVIDENKVLAVKLLRIISGNTENPKAMKFQPRTDEDKKLVKAADFLLKKTLEEQSPA
jgi:hypothetical protein